MDPVYTVIRIQRTQYQRLQAVAEAHLVKPHLLLAYLIDRALAHEHELEVDLSRLPQPTACAPRSSIAPTF